MGSYGLALWAMTQAPLAVVAALRETSILFGALIAWLLLKEKVAGLRLVAAGGLPSGRFYSVCHDCPMTAADVTHSRQHLLPLLFTYPAVPSSAIAGRCLAFFFWCDRFLSHLWECAASYSYFFFFEK